MPGRPIAGGIVDGAADVFPLLHQGVGLTFEQQRELLLLQMEHEKLKHRVEVDKQLALEKMKIDTKQPGITLELEKLALITEGKLSLEAGQGPGGDCVSLGYRS